MQERVYSLETEYAVAFQPQAQQAAPDKAMLVDVLQTLLIRRFGIKQSAFLINGSKFHYDVGHAEWSLPECRSAYEAAIYDKAADWSLGSIVAEAEQALARNGYRGTLFVVKNNVDSYGNTYGCHENYMAERQTAWLRVGDYLLLTARYLIPFLVSRQILCSTGRIGYGQLNSQVGFQIMQRADFIEEVVSISTTKERAIVSISREDEPLARGNYRRLHLILADACLSGFATYLKLGITGMILRMLEELGFAEIPHLIDPIAALQAISRDPTCTVRIPLQDGRELTAIQLQRMYLKQAKQFLNRAVASSAEQQILQHWEATLNQLQNAPKQLIGKIDWVTKKWLMDQYLQRQGKQWQDLTSDQPEWYELLRMDIQYHNLVTQRGLFYRLLKEQPDSFLPSDAIEQARHVPPAYTRAWIRGTVIAAARQSGLKVGVEQWDSLNINSRKILLDSPLQFSSPELYAIANPRNQHQLTIYCEDSDLAHQVGKALKQSGYNLIEYAEQPNDELNIKCGSASDEIVQEIAQVIGQVLPRTQDQINVRRSFAADDSEIYINLGGVLVKPQPLLDRTPYAITIMADVLERGEQLAEALEQLGYQVNAVIPGSQPEFKLLWGSALPEIVQDLLQAIYQTYSIAESQISQQHDYANDDDRILITLEGTSALDETEQQKVGLWKRWFGRSQS